MGIWTKNNANEGGGACQERIGDDSTPGKAQGLTTIQSLLPGVILSLTATLLVRASQATTRRTPCLSRLSSAPHSA